MEARHAQENRLEKREVRYFVASVGFLLLTVLLSVFIPTPSEWQMLVLRLVLALAAAAFTAFLPGLLTVEGALPKGSFLNNAKVKASGAFAVWLLVYYYAPHIMRK